MAFASPTATMAANGTKANGSHPSESTCELVLLGTGVSTALPQISCVLPSATHHCAVCRDGLANPASPNRRANVSALVRSGDRNVLIDCGKTVREAALRHFPGLGVGRIDAIVLTHGHADAMLGLDDVRDLVPRLPKGAPPLPPMPVYMSDETFAVCKRVFPYLVPEKHTDEVERRVASIDWRPFSDDELFHPFYPVGDGVEFVPIPLLHGGDYVCIGFIIRVKGGLGATVAYLSDVKKVPPETMEYLEKLPKIDILIVDALAPKNHNTHFSLDEAIELTRKLRPDVTKFVGMGCRAGLHDERNAELRKLKESDGLDVQLAYDGLHLPL